MEATSAVQSPQRAKWLVPSLVAASVLVAIGLCVLLMWPTWAAHLVVPSPKGLVFQVELPAIGSLWDRFVVFAIERNGPAIVVIDPGNSVRTRQILVYRYPTGEQLECDIEYSAGQLARIESERASAPSAIRDFDGDGSCDATAHIGLGHGRAIVTSGRDGTVLYDSVEPLEYEDNERLTLLGDLDDDGHSELAVAHPRSDRSEYDFEPLDRMLGAKSWLSIVSGKRATAAAAESNR